MSSLIHAQGAHVLPAFPACYSLQANAVAVLGRCAIAVAAPYGTRVPAIWASAVTINILLVLLNTNRIVGKEFEGD